jgi:hypothetical protein
VTEARGPESAAGAHDLTEALAALRLPPAGLRRWLEQSQAFCARHGGRRYYAELLDLYDECLTALDARTR